MAPATSAKTDVLIIGMGAAGGIAASVLTKAGLKVVGIEAGPRVTSQDFLARLDEIGEGFAFRNHLGAPKFNREVPTYRLDAKSPTLPATIAYGMANCVGGSSAHYTCLSWRHHEDDFSVRSSTIARYGHGAIPPGASVVDWPLTYRDLEPYYDKVEYQIGVSGKAGANPFEAPRRRGYPMPPLQPAGYPTMVADVAKKMGLHPFPAPAAITSEIYNDRPPCSFCGFCSGFGCWNGSKSSTAVSSIPEAERTGNLTLLTNSRVMSILTDSTGRATGVEYLDARGRKQTRLASFVILSSFAFENVRLLLLSKTSAYPDGLSNNYSQLGKYYTPQVETFLNALYPGKALNIWAGTGGQTMVIDDYDADHFDHRGLGFIRGASAFVSVNGTPIASSTAVPPGQPLWGSSYKRWLHDNSGAIGGFILQQEALAYEANFLDLDPVKKDDLGVPVIRITWSPYANENRMSRFMVERFSEVLKASGATQVWSGPPRPDTTHSYGGTRMGTDPATSVVNQYSISHEVPNLAIMSGSTFCSTSGLNPTETIQALAWYGAEHIAQNFHALTA